MIYAAIITIALGLLLLSWFLFRRNFELFLCLLIVINFDFFYVLPSFHYALILVSMLSVMLLADLLAGKLTLGRYGWWVIGFLGISIFGIFVAWFSGQSILYGIKAAKYVPLVMIYFLTVSRKIDCEKFAAYFVIMGCAIAVLDIVYMFTHLNIFRGMPEYMLEHLGRRRVVVGQFVIAAATVIAFAQFRKGASFMYLPVSAALFASLCFVQQTRGFIVGALLGIIIVFILSQRLTMLRAATYALFVLTLAIVLFAVDLKDFGLHRIGVVERTMADFSKKGGSYGSSLQARINSYHYYWEQLCKRPITGHGLLNLNWPGNLEKYVQKRFGIWRADIGIMAFLAQTGLLGAIWFAYGLLRIWKDVFRYRKFFVISSYFVIGTITMPNLDMFFRSSPPELSLFLFATFLGIFAGTIEREHSLQESQEQAMESPQVRQTVRREPIVIYS